MCGFRGVRVLLRKVVEAVKDCASQVGAMFQVLLDRTSINKEYVIHRG